MSLALLQLYWSRDSSGVRVPDLRSKGYGFKEQWDKKKKSAGSTFCADIVLVFLAGVCVLTRPEPGWGRAVKTTCGVFAGLPLVVARLLDQRLHCHLLLHLLRPLLLHQAGDAGQCQWLPLLRLHLHHCFCLLLAHR